MVKDSGVDAGVTGSTRGKWRGYRCCALTCCENKEGFARVACGHGGIRARVLQRLLTLVSAYGSAIESVKPNHIDGGA